MKRKTVLCLALCLLMLLPILGSCDPAPVDTSSAAPVSTDVSAESSAEVSAEAQFPYADENFDGTTIKIYAVSVDRHVYGELQFVPDPDKTGNVVNDAVAERNNFIKENYGIDIVVEAASYPTENLKTLIEGGACDYDLVCDSVDRMVGCVTEKLFWSVDDYIDLDNPWWDRECIDAITLSDSHYFLAGDALITDDDHVYLTLYNKDLYAENTDMSTKYGDIYQLVRDKKFTLDAFYEMSKAVAHTDDSGAWSTNATYGNLSHSYGATIMVNGAGLALAEKTSDGDVRINVDSERGVSVYDKVFALMSDTQITTRAELLAGKMTEVNSKYGFAELEYMFVNGRGLFYNTTSSSISLLKTSTAKRDFEFGVLPIPMFDETQDNYYNSVNRYQSSVVGIPTSNKNNIEATAFLLEALGYYSKEVTKAYYQLTLQLQAVDEDADAEMLDIIYSNRFYDLGAIYTWGNLAGIYGSTLSNAAANGLISAWESMEDTVNTAKDQTVEEYRNSLT